MKIQLSDHFNYGRLLRFTLPTIIMMIFTSIYGVVDGIFVSNYAGKTAFAAINLIMPVTMIIGAIGFMFGTGGCALVAKTMGEGEKKKAGKIFSMLIYISIVIGIVLSALGFIFIEPVAALLGAEGQMLKDCATYGRILFPAMTCFILQSEFQSFFVAVEKPNLGLLVAVCAGVTNIVLDALFVALFDWGLVGAAVATAISQTVGGIVPLLYFIFSKKSLLKLGKPYFDKSSLVKTCINGSSEMMTNISMSLVNMLYNYQLMKFAGEDGVAAFGVIMYVGFIFVTIFIGYSVGSAPIVSFHYGAQNLDELKNLFKKSITIIGVTSIFMTTLGIMLAGPLSRLFVGYDEALFDMTKKGFIIYSLSYLFAGINIYGSSFFTALNDGPVSAIISFLRTLLFQVVSVLVLPLIFDLDGIWFALVVAEIMAIIVTSGFLITKKKKYQY